MSETTARLALPLIAPGQAQKELTHNEALAAIDMAVMPAVVATGATVPPADPAPGQCWVLGASPSGAWSGHAHAIAGWTAGGWRFLPAREGMAVWAGAGTVRYVAGAWNDGMLIGPGVLVGDTQVVGPQADGIADPAGGSVVDTEARAAVAALLAAARTHGLIAP